MNIVFYITHVVMLICTGGILWSILPEPYDNRKPQTAQSLASVTPSIKVLSWKLVLAGLNRVAISLMALIIRVYIGHKS